MTTDSKTPDGTGNVVDLSTAPVRRDCMNCGGFVMTNPRAKPLCINCRDRGLRTDDDVAEAMAQARREAFRLCADVDRGVAGDVAALNAVGFETTDSGDGSKAEWMEGAMGVPNIAVRLADGQVPQDCLTHLGPAWEVADAFEVDGVAYCCLLMKPEED